MLSIFVATAEIHSRSVMKEALSAGEKVLASGRDSVRFSGRSMPVPVPGCDKGVADASLRIALIEAHVRSI
ncbi:hypothetical protein MPL3365_130481 [Mesorhizobium plurifarium]|uniref:Uncharacterized protein n=1 Tax=Mesorhizobium plurifarium TaxID=69974 RepID=A0A090G3M2_MESPL|nr:hypothetical protein MPL3365_130481 [Mesorhizobium plurifarium]